MYPQGWSSDEEAALNLWILRRLGRGGRTPNPATEDLPASMLGRAPWHAHLAKDPEAEGPLIRARKGPELHEAREVFLWGTPPGGNRYPPTGKEKEAMEPARDSGEPP